ncbi:TPA: hypothetical protein U2Q33_000795 [Citrobacter farmeri]|nr:hypothetical protein [Citrobacter farmeri]
MKLFEMEGFLRGKCLPGDMKVNETNAEYLVRKFTELEQNLAESQREFRAADATIENMQMQLEKMTEESAGLKAVIAENWNMRDVLRQLVSTRPGGVYFNKWEQVILKALNETPATDAFLAEVRAQGADECVRQLVISDAADDFTDAPNVCAMVAHLLRKGVQS